MSIGDGSNTDIWTDPWVVGIQNLSPTIASSSDGLTLKKVRELMNSDATAWDNELVEQTFRPEEAQKILNIPLKEGQQDAMIWTPHKQGKFSVKSAYLSILSERKMLFKPPESSKQSQRLSKTWKTTWALKIKNKIKVFLWRCWYKYLGTNDQLIKRGILVDPICSVCGSAEESLDHILFFCPCAVKVWKHAGLHWEGMHLSNFTFQTWWQDICSMKRIRSFHDRIHFSSYILWWLWKSRNIWIFNKIWKSEVDIARGAWAEWVEFEEVSNVGS
ncbi:Unknown protein [Striga hermonthica]|uniref:Reverse transcriptase zinc-binding domain-containing protein n=1 Tax=Striga hermonthica TaxID=68872 RepID=A0A9N7RP29_STRHE|nr:Unknown protein [Striga hermonthica]